MRRSLLLLLLWRAEPLFGDQVSGGQVSAMYCVYTWSWCRTQILNVWRFSLRFERGGEEKVGVLYKSTRFNPLSKRRHAPGSFRSFEARELLDALSVLFLISSSSNMAFCLVPVYSWCVLLDASLKMGKLRKKHNWRGREQSERQQAAAAQEEQPELVLELHGQSLHVNTMFLSVLLDISGPAVNLSQLSSCLWNNIHSVWLLTPHLDHISAGLHLKPPLLHLSREDYSV